MIIEQEQASICNGRTEVCLWCILDENDFIEEGKTIEIEMIDGKNSIREYMI